MKKAILSIFFMGIMFHTPAQQNTFIGGILFDLNGIGLLGNTGQYWNSSKENVGAGHGGISCGIFIKREFSRGIYSVFEIRYSTKGSFYGYDSPYAVKASESLYLNYIELPFLVGYQLKHFKKSYYLETGLEFSKLANSKIESNIQPQRTNMPGTEDFKSNDISWIGSFKFPLIRKMHEHFLMGIRVTRSIRSIHEYYDIYNFEYGIEFNYRFN